MKRTDVAIIAFKLLGLYLFVRALEALSGYLSLIFTSSPGLQHIEIAQIIIPTSLNLVIGLALWRWALVIATTIFRNEVAATDSSISLADLQAICFSIVGVVMLVSAIPDITRELAYYYGIKSISDVQPSPELSAKVQSMVVGSFVKCVISAYLILGSTGIVNIIRWSRTA